MHPLILPTYGTSKDDSTPFIEVNAPYYYYLAYERGVKCINRQTTKLEDLLYWVFQDITFDLAMSYEPEHRIPAASHDYRKAIFTHQLELLNSISLSWKKKREQEIAAIISDHPDR